MALLAVRLASWRGCFEFGQLPSFAMLQRAAQCSVALRHAGVRHLHANRSRLLAASPGGSSTDFLTGISALINASRNSATKGLWHMSKQERADMTGHLELHGGRGTPLTPGADRTGAQVARAQASAPGNSSNTAAPSAAGAPAASDASGFSRASARSPAAASPSLSKSANPFPAVLPLDSFWSVSLPFDTDPGLYDEYVRFDGGIRFERILEDMDAFAGHVAHLHVKQGTEKLLAAHKAAEAANAQQGDKADSGPSKLDLPELQIVTASVDGITMNPRHRFPMNKHLVMQGCTTWVGKSSMEQWIEIRVVRDPAAWSRLTLEEKMRASGADPAADRDDVVVDAFFLMVARDAKTQKAAFVPPIDVAALGEVDRARFERGEESAVRRKREAATSLQRTPPTSDEIGLIHELLIAENGSGTGSALGSLERTHRMSMSAVDPPSAAVEAVLASPAAASVADQSSPQRALTIRPKSVPMADTELQSAAMTQPQDRNTNGKIFGGYLMSHAYELARANAYLFCGAQSAPYFVAVDHITFLRAVEIGSIITFRSKVAYAAGHPDPHFQLRVETLVHDLLAGSVFPSNVFHFTFRCDSRPVRRVLPHTYREAVDFVDGRRRREKLERKLRAAEGDAAQADGTEHVQQKPPVASLADASAPAS